MAVINIKKSENYIITPKIDKRLEKMMLKQYIKSDTKMTKNDAKTTYNLTKPSKKDATNDAIMAEKLFHNSRK